MDGFTFGSLLDPKKNRERLSNLGFYRDDEATPIPKLDSYAPTSQSPMQGTEFSVAPKVKRQSYNQNAVTRVIKGFIDAGYPPEFAVGMAANAMVESGGNPEAYNESEGAFGLFQHRNDRLSNLRQFAERIGSNATDIGSQVSFAAHELQTFEKAAYDKIMGYNPSSAVEYAALIDKYWERSDGRARDKRRNIAGQIWEDYFGEGGQYEAYASGGSMEGTPQAGGTPISFKPGTPNVNMQDYMFGLEGKELPFEVVKDKQEQLPFSLFSMGEDTNEPIETATYPLGTPDADSEVSRDQSPTQGTGGGGSVAPSAAVTQVDAPSPADTPENRRFLERLLDKMYGTEGKDISEEERRARQQAIGMALSEGFQMLSRGGDMNLAPVMEQKAARIDAAQQRKDAAAQREALKQNASVVSDMLIAAGHADKAQLPYLGEEGMGAAISLLSKSGQGSGETFTLPNGYRATLAQTAIDMGRPDFAEGLLTLNGKPLEDVYNTVLGLDAPDPEDGPAYPPEVRARLKEQFLAQGNEFAAGMVDYADEDTIGKMIEQQSAVDPGVQEAVGTRVGLSQVDQQQAAQQAEEVALGFDTANMPAEAAIIRATKDPQLGFEVVRNMQQQEALVAERSDIKARGEAVANLIPDSLENAAELKEAARTALTSQDLDAVYEKMNPEKLKEQELYELAMADPNFAKWYLNTKRAEGGNEKLSFADQLFSDAVTTFSEQYNSARLEKASLIDKMEAINRMARNKNVQSGLLQEQLFYPAQRVLNSVGLDGTRLISNESEVAAKLIEAFRNSEFSAMRAEGSGQTSDMESRKFLAALPSFGESRQQLLALSQAYIRMSEIKEAEYNAMMEFLRHTPEGSANFTSEKMWSYVREQTKDMTIFKQFNVNDEDGFAKAIASGNVEVGEVVEMVQPNGSYTYIVVGFNRGE